MEPLELTDAQRRVLEHDGGPLLVLGGPGTGKTTVLEQRYLRLAVSAGLAPHRILILCSNRAYSMAAKDRLFMALPHRASIEIPVYTWHALAYHLVSRYYPAFGYREPPVLLTGAEQWGLVRELLAGESPLDWPRWGDRLKEPAFVDEVADFCLRVEQRMLDDDGLEAIGSHREDWAEVVRFYQRYREFLKTQSRTDYAGLIASAVRMLGENDGVRDTLRRRFPHVMVDEGEEMSRAQRRLLSLLETEHLVVAGNPDSGIETFRGAEPDWLLGFEALAGPHATVVLTEGHRVGEPLASAAGSLISFNIPDESSRMSAAASATSFDCVVYPSVATEVDAIGRELRRLHLFEGVAWDRMAVLISQPAFLLAPLERALDRWEVPYRPMAGDRALASQPSIAAFLDLVRVALHHDKWEETLVGLLTTPLIGLDYATRRSLERRAWQEGRSLREIAELAPETEVFRRLRDLVLEKADRADECFWAVYEASDHYRSLASRAASDLSDPANEDLDALVAFSHALGRFVERRHGRASIATYVAEAVRADFGGDPWLASSRGAASTGVSLLSFHASKGREWEVVVVAGCLDTWIPKGRRAQGLFDPFAVEIGDLAEREVEAIADDRRTFYVAATRASHRAIFTVSPGPSGRGRPSRFLTEMGVPVAEYEPAESPPLTSAEMRARLRRTLEKGPAASSSERVAAVVALAETPGTEPSRWYGRWDWTEGSVPLEAPGEFKTSYSRLGVYENCGLQYVLESVLGLDPTTTHAMKFGTWMHLLFQAIYEGLIVDQPTLRKEYARLFDDQAFPNATIARQYRRDGERMLDTFLRYEFKGDHKMVKTEYAFAVPFSGATLRGRIDRIDKRGPNLILTDYKTAKWATGKLEAETSLQLAIYHLAARNDPELTVLGKPSSARLLFPGATYAAGDPVIRVQNAEAADPVIETIPTLIEGVLNEDFAPRPEADCNWCSMKPLCPLWPQGRELGEP